MLPSDPDAEAVFHKIAHAAMKLHSFGSTMTINEQLADALRRHLSELMDKGVRDYQTLIDEGVAFLRRQETKKYK